LTSPRRTRPRPRSLGSLSGLGAPRRAPASASMTWTRSARDISSLWSRTSAKSLGIASTTTSPSRRSRRVFCRRKSRNGIGFRTASRWTRSSPTSSICCTCPARGCCARASRRPRMASHFGRRPSRRWTSCWAGSKSTTRTRTVPHNPNLRTRTRLRHPALLLPFMGQAPSPSLGGTRTIL